MQVKESKWKKALSNKVPSIFEEKDYISSENGLTVNLCFNSPSFNQ